MNLFGWGKPKARRFRCVGGFHDGETAAIEIRVDDSGYRSVRLDGKVSGWSDGTGETLNIASAERRVALGQWEEVQ